MPSVLERAGAWMRGGQPSAPAKPQQVISATDGDLLDLVDRRYNYARDAKQELLETWATCLAFYSGDQWRKWDTGTRRLVKQNKLPSYRVLAVYNQLPGIVDLAAAKLSRARELPRGRPDEANDPEDRERAERGTNALRSWWHREALEQHEHEVNVNRIIFGAGFLHLYWDPSKLVKLPQQVGWMLDEETGEVVPRMQGVWAPAGDVCSEVRTVFDIFPEPGERFTDASWLFDVKRKPVRWFKDTFDQDVEPDEADQEGVFSSLIPGFEGKGGEASGGAPRGEGMATLKVMYERPCRDYPQGRTVMTAGKQVLFQHEELPLPHEGLKNPLPVKMLGYRYVPKRLWPKGLIEENISPQRELNRSLGNLSELFRLYRSPKRWVDKAWRVREDAITDAPNEVIEGDFQGANPAAYVESPPQLPAWVAQMPERWREELRHTANQNEVSEGSVPGGVTAASAIALLQQSENQRLSSPALLGKMGLEDFFKHALCVMDKRYREPRMVTVPGRGQDQDTAVIPPNSFGPLEVVVEMADGVEDTDVFRQEQIRAWMQVGLFDLPPPFIMSILEASGQSWLADALAEAAPEVQAQQQQQMMMQQAQEQAGMEREDQVRGEEADREDQRRQEDRAAAQEEQQLQAQLAERSNQSGMAQTMVRALLSGGRGQSK